MHSQEKISHFPPKSAHSSAVQPQWIADEMYTPQWARVRPYTRFKPHFFPYGKE